MTSLHTPIRIALSNNKSESDGLPDLYFAYGSNMNLSQIRSRCSRPVAKGIARLSNHRIEFFGRTEKWDSAMETVEEAPGHEVWGVMFALSQLDWERLDLWQDARMDGAGMYFHFPVSVVDLDGREHSVRLYKKDILGEVRDPSREYLDHILRGASEHGLPPNYIEQLKQRRTHNASYSVPLLPGYDMGRSAEMTCADCASGAA